ncbi:tRNA (adenosine(37)-N6)-threonylcarbamoyltransferase complex ATPase subunit type 1 TsaE [Permianibacter sp. IMCC34836]|uniref:tRNA (adenosine(37)-N6)-threonylcarbamoyltransferase complex ATPase subunit type 1 TsaE n=1 Tax=Permianibacter fluminis TaxID=2738515 RepID=UPI001554EDE9|nr:tRNA (adenosine(37)-N6)-threonylcarbamoyltransferase complex ATPase subunit type 1 TsaE [Permianibacter fluminis]NQD38953.1 tRNA (adenosine(37)-N6)-threonylcarbamoyltransferase complex ATPase subunit type 1 TsaE [Permianibacter fluminis]
MTSQPPAPTSNGFLPDEAATEQIGALIAPHLRGGEVLTLSGDLGAGKTTLVRGLLRALGHQGAVKSPTYTLVESYRLPAFELHHFDLYRLAEAGELEFLGLDEFLHPGAVCLFEWPERGAGVLPPGLSISLAREGSGRRLQVSANGPLAQELVKKLDLSMKSIDYLKV